VVALREVVGIARVAILLICPPGEGAPLATFGLTACTFLGELHHLIARPDEHKVGTLRPIDVTQVSAGSYGAFDLKN